MGLEPLQGSEVEDVKVFANGELVDTFTISEGEQIDLGRIPIDVNIGEESVELSDGDSIEIKDDMQWGEVRTVQLNYDDDRIESRSGWPCQYIEVDVLEIEDRYDEGMFIIDADYTNTGGSTRAVSVTVNEDNVGETFKFSSGLSGDWHSLTTSRCSVEFRFYRYPEIGSEVVV